VAQTAKIGWLIGKEGVELWIAFRIRGL
jgi:hypothetical protein